LSTELHKNYSKLEWKREKEQNSLRSYALIYKELVVGLIAQYKKKKGKNNNNK
jgi:hypothetical protein